MPLAGLLTILSGLASQQTHTPSHFCPEDKSIIGSYWAKWHPSLTGTELAVSRRGHGHTKRAALTSEISGFHGGEHLDCWFQGYDSVYTVTNVSEELILSFFRAKVINDSFHDDFNYFVFKRQVLQEGVLITTRYEYSDSINVGNLLTSWPSVSFSRRTLRHAVYCM
jgi:hypothetical protein